MQDTTTTEFEWNERKRESTIEKHGIDFEDAIRIFDGRPVVHAPSSYPDEDRWLTTGRLSGRMVSVVWTYRSSKIRIITARRAGKNEQRRYHKSHLGGCSPPEG